MFKRIHKCLLSTAIAACLLSGPGTAAVINFDDVSVGTGSMDFVFPDQGYQGFQWLGASTTGSWVISNEAGSWFPADEAFSGPNYAWSNGANNLSLIAPLFDFIGFMSRSGPGTTFGAIAHGYLNGVEIYTQAFTVTGQYQLFNFNFLGIDELTITDQVNNILFDDIVVNLRQVPEPAPLALLGLALAGLAVGRRR